MSGDGAKLYAFPGVAIPDRPVGAQPQPHVIAMLENLLARARTGDLQAIAVSFVNADRSVADDWRHGSNTTHELIAGVAYLQARIMSTAIRNGEADTDSVPPPQGA